MKHFTPAQYQFQDRHKYPQDNHIDFEYWLATNTLSQEVPKGWTYLPVTWTAYYKANGYGARIEPLQKWLDTLPTDKKYFTIHQYDDGLLNNVSHLNLRTYAMGSPGDYQLPLICQPHGYRYNGPKDIFCSFVGRVTHSIRQAIIDQLQGKDGYYISTKPHNLQQFCDILARSKYVLAPRGYGMTSFRIAEALQYNSCPVYISDKHLYPHDLKNSWVNIGPKDDIADALNNYEYSDCYDMIYKAAFTYSANKELILKDLKQQV